MKGRVYQILNLGPSFSFMTKNGKLYAIFFSTIFSTMHRIKNRLYINILKHSFLPNDIENEY